MYVVSIRSYIHRRVKRKRSIFAMIELRMFRWVRNMSLNPLGVWFFKENDVINLPLNALKTNNVLISLPNNISSFSIKTDLS